MTPGLVQAFVVSDLVIALSYAVLSYLFAGMIRRRHNKALWPVFYFLGLFIFICGMTHLMGAIVAHVAVYRVAVVVNVACAGISLLAAIVTALDTPRVMRVPPIGESFDRFIELKQIITDELNRITDEPDEAKLLARVKQLHDRLEGR